MKKSIFILALMVSTFSFANSPRNSCKVKLILSTKVYAQSDFRAEPLTYLSKGDEVELIGYHKGFYTILINNQKAFITEANIKPDQEFREFKEYVIANPLQKTETEKKQKFNHNKNSKIFASN